MLKQRNLGVGVGVVETTCLQDEHFFTFKFNGIS